MRFAITLLPLLMLQAVLADNAPLEGWLVRQSSITSLDSRFTQERRLPALKEPVTTAGRLSFVRPDKVRWQLGDPIATLAVSDGTHLTLIETGPKTARRTGADSPQAARFSLLTGRAFESPEKFREAFEVVESRVSSGIHQYTLKAKDRRIRSQIPWIFIDIDPVRNELRALEMELQDKSRIRTVFHEPRFNVKLDGSLFTPDLTGYDVK